MKDFKKKRNKIRLRFWPWKNKVNTLMTKKKKHTLSEQEKKARFKISPFSVNKFPAQV